MSSPLPATGDAIDPSNADTLTDLLVQMAFAVMQELSEIGAEHELSLTQVRMLGVLRDREPGVLELARHLRLEKSSASGLIDRAERRGLVARSAGPADGRTVRVAITPVGAAIAARSATALESRLDALLEGLSVRDRAQLERLLRGLVGHQRGA